VLAFIRPTAHYWSGWTHPDLFAEETKSDGPRKLLSSNDELARLLLQGPDLPPADARIA
jgi:hypothetical protein